MTLSRTVFRDAPAGILMMEMPAYRAPSPKRVFRYTWNESSAFVRKAGSFILVGTVVFWLLLNMPWGATDLRQSWFGTGQQRGRSRAWSRPVSATWEASGALVTGLLAKEIVVSTLSQVYVGEAKDAADTAAPPSLLEGLTRLSTGFVAGHGGGGQAIAGDIHAGRHALCRLAAEETIRR